MRLCASFWNSEVLNGGQPDPLSAQQRRIADLAAAGQGTKQIAAQLSLSVAMKKYPLAAK